MSIDRKIYLLIMLMIPVLSLGQDKPAVKVISRTLNDEVTLRWACNTPLSWQHANKYGYVIERQTIGRKGKALQVPEKNILTPVPVKPRPLEEWETLAKQNKYAAVGAQTIYGKTFELKTQSTDVFQMINKANETEDRFSFALFCADQAAEVAELMGLKYSDTTIKKGEQYLYKIYTQVPDNIMKIDTGFVLADADVIIKLPKPSGFKAEFSDSIVLLNWNKIYYESIYSSYLIERSDDGGKTFNPVNDNAFISASPKAEISGTNATYQDFVPEYKKYIYRIKGRTYFGDYGPYSDLVEGTSVPIPTATPSIVSGLVLDNQRIIIKWDFPSEQVKNIKGFKIYVSDKLKGSYKETTKEIIDKGKREFEYTKPTTANYFIIKTVDLKGAEYSSLPYLVQLKDETPPSVPQNVKGIIDSTGAVRLNWKKNPELDLFGYRVYKANSKNDEFSQVTKSPVSDTVFSDTVTLNTLSKNVYYKIVALDNHFNPSALSEAIAVKRPDTIAPPAPVFINYSISDTSVYLEWHPSPGEDVEKHLLLRKESTEASWKEIAVISKNEKNNFNDRNLKPKLEYEYCLIAMDDSRNKSNLSLPLKVKLLDKGIRPMIKKIKTEVDRSKHEITLTWDYSYEGIFRFMIYRAEEGEPLRLYKSVDSDIFKLIDTNLIVNTKYSYSIRAKYKDGGSSPFSEEVIIKY